MGFDARLLAFPMVHWARSSPLFAEGRQHMSPSAGGHLGLDSGHSGLCCCFPGFDAGPVGIDSQVISQPGQGVTLHSLAPM